MNIFTKGLVLLASTVSFYAHADWSDSDALSLGRNLSVGYGIDVVDHFNGQLKIVQTDYQLLLGQDSYFPINRTIKTSSYRAINVGSSGSSPLVGSVGGVGSGSLLSYYNLGQLHITVPDQEANALLHAKSGAASESDEGNSSICERIKDNRDEIKDDRDYKATFRAPNAESILFDRKGSSPDVKEIVSANNWVLSCDPDEESYAVQISGPDGFRYYYSSISSGFMGENLPKLIKDPNNNYAIIERTETTGLTIRTRFQTINFDKGTLHVSGQAQPVVKTEKINDGYRVTYSENSTWTVHRHNSNHLEVCSPLGTCANYEFDNLNIRHMRQQNRLVKKTYNIPFHGSYVVEYEYEYDKSDHQLTVVAKHANHIREYKYFLDVDKNYLWRNGTAVSEAIRPLSGAGYYQRTSYDYEPSRDITSNPWGSTYSGPKHVVPRQTKKTVERWSDTTTPGQFTWVGSVEVRSSEFDDYNFPQRVQYRYPDNNGGTLFPDLTVRTEKTYDFDIHRLDRVANTQIIGMPYQTQYSYDHVGNLIEANTNGRVETFSYNEHGEMLSETDAAGNTYQYSDHSYGVARQELGPEGYILTRTLDNGFVDSETLYGNRTTHSKFDQLGKLLEYQPAEPGREPIRYHYTFPTGGGAVLVEENGALLKTTRYNGMGLPYQVEVEGVGSATGEAYHYIKYLEYYDDGSLKAESLAVPAGTQPEANQYTRFEQDPVGRRTRLLPVDGQPIEFHYDQPFTTHMINGDGVETIERYRLFGEFGTEKLVERIHPPGNTLESEETVLSLTYLDNGWLDRVAIGGEVHYYNYDESTGDLASVFTPETGLIAYEYDANGRVIREQKNSDTAVNFYYDGLGRLTLKDYDDDSANVVYSYDPINRTESREKNAFTWYTHYDLDGNLIQEYLVHDIDIDPPAVVNNYPLYERHLGRSETDNRNVPDRSVMALPNLGDAVESKGYLDWDFHYHYDSKGFLASVTYPDGEVVGYLSNELGRPTQVGPYANNIQYFPDGSLRTLTFANGQQVNYLQDSATGLLTEVQLGSLWRKRYHYSDSGYLAGIEDLYNSSVSRFFEYDQLYQLRRVRSQSALGPIVEDFGYNPSGDILQRTSGSSEITYQYNEQTNRLSSVTIDGQVHLLGYTPDGRVTTFGQSDYVYTDDKFLAEFSEPDGQVYRYEYDANDSKVRASVGGELERYTIHGMDGRLLYEERPGDASTNFIYLQDRLVATRDTEYDLAYTECDYIENRAQRETILYHRPIWLRRFDHEPVSYGDCEEYSRWPHNYETDSGTWSTISSTRLEYYVWMNHYDDTGLNRGSLYDFLLYTKTKTKNGGVVREYSVPSSTRRRYSCYQPWRVYQYTYNENGEQIGQRIVSSGRYFTGRSRTWYAWQSKPSFSCGNPTFDPSKMGWS